MGAPQFFQRDGEVGGAVYVYINKAGKWNSVVPTRLNGTKDSMFGLAVKTVGDINLDSYEGGIFLGDIHTICPQFTSLMQNTRDFILRE